MCRSVARYFGVGTAARSDRISWYSRARRPGSRLCRRARLEWWYARRESRAVGHRRPRTPTEEFRTGRAALGWASAKRVKLKHDTESRRLHTIIIIIIIIFRRHFFIFPSAHTLLHRFAFPLRRHRTYYFRAKTAAMDDFYFRHSPPPLDEFYFGTTCSRGRCPCRRIYAVCTSFVVEGKGIQVSADNARKIIK